MHIPICIKLAILEEGQQVHRGKVTSRIVQEHIFRTGVRPTDRPVCRACVPCVNGVMELDARIGTGPCSMTNLFPQITGLQGFGGLAVHA